MDDEQHAAAGWLERVPSWVFLAILAGCVLLAFVLSWAMPGVFWHPPTPRFEMNDARCTSDTHHLTGYGVFYDYYWGPILCDEGYTTVNTATWALLLGLLLLWAYRLTVELREKVDFGLIVGVVPFLVWGSIYRVLEDTDLFASYNRPGGPIGHGFLDRWLGAFFITPLIYVEILFIAVGFLLLSRRARAVGKAQGLGRGLRYYGLSLLALVALYTAMWAAGPTYIRYAAHPVIVLAAALLAFYVVWRDALARGEINQRVGLGAYGLVFLVVGLYYVVSWMTGGLGTWRPLPADPAASVYPPPDASVVTQWPVQWWILLGMIAGPALVAYACWRQGRILGHPTDASNLRKSYNGPVAALVVALLIEALAAFTTVVGLRDLGQRGLAAAWRVNPGDYARTFGLLAAGPVLIWAGSRVLRAVGDGPIGRHPALLFYTMPLNLLMVLGQMTDALMTSLGIDFYHYNEKHVLGRTLIDGLRTSSLPAPFHTFAATLVMIPLKLLIVLLVVVAIDAGSDAELKERENLVGLVKLGIIMVGLSPGVRDGIRLAMGT